MTYQLTQGVTKNIIPAIASTNAIGGPAAAAFVSACCLRQPCTAPHAFCSHSPRRRCRRHSPSHSAAVAAQCALEALKMVTLCSTGLNNYMM